MLRFGAKVTTLVLINGKIVRICACVRVQMGVKGLTYARVFGKESLKTSTAKHSNVLREQMI